MKIKCTKCKEYKNQIDFYKKYLQCKTCCKINMQKYLRTEKGLISQIYSDQRGSSKKRGHIQPNYTKEDLSLWMYKNNFKKLYNTWIKSEYNKELKPSCDRHSETELDYDSKPYCLTRLRLITWKENNDKANQDKSKGLLNITFKKVNQFTKDNIFIKSFDSIKDAGTKLNIDSAHIGKACKDKLKTSGGFIWKYA